MGSEMCIRDRGTHWPNANLAVPAVAMWGLDSHMRPSEEVLAGVRKSEPPFSNTTIGALGARTIDA